MRNGFSRTELHDVRIHGTSGCRGCAETLAHPPPGNFGLPATGDSYIPAALLALESMKRQTLLENHAALRQTTAMMAREVARLAH